MYNVHVYHCEIRIQLQQRKTISSISQANSCSLLLVLFFYTYYEWDIDSADCITLSQSRAGGSLVKMKHLALGVFQELLVRRKLDKLLCPVFPVKGDNRWLIWSHDGNLLSKHPKYRYTCNIIGIMKQQQKRIHLLIRSVVMLKAQTTGDRHMHSILKFNMVTTSSSIHSKLIK